MWCVSLNTSWFWSSCYLLRMSLLSGVLSEERNENPWRTGSVYSITIPPIWYSTLSIFHSHSQQIPRRNRCPMAHPLGQIRIVLCELSSIVVVVLSAMSCYMTVYYRETTGSYIQEQWYITILGTGIYVVICTTISIQGNFSLQPCFVGLNTAVLWPMML